MAGLGPKLGRNRAKLRRFRAKLGRLRASPMSWSSPGRCEQIVDCVGPSLAGVGPILVDSEQVLGGDSDFPGQRWASLGKCWPSLVEVGSKLDRWSIPSQVGRSWPLSGPKWPNSGQIGPIPGNIWSSLVHPGRNLAAHVDTSSVDFGPNLAESGRKRLMWVDVVSDCGELLCIRAMHGVCVSM